MKHLLHVIVSAALGMVPALGYSISPESMDNRSAPRLPGPIQDKRVLKNGSVESSNWSGYAVTGSSFTSVKGSWVVPDVDCTSNIEDLYAAFWVGLDGYSSNTVEQVGTSSDCNGTTPVYYAWYEFYPNPMNEITSVPVLPGDIISASVTYTGKTNKFTVSIINETTGKSYSKTAAVRSARRTSAEWIVEAPCCANHGEILPLSDFGTVGFGVDNTNLSSTNYATNSTHKNMPIGDFPTKNIWAITKIPSESSPQTSTCTALSNDRSSFTCTWAP